MSSPHDTPYTFVTKPGAGQPAWHGPVGYDWKPSDSPDDPYQDIDDQSHSAEHRRDPGPFSRSRSQG